MPVVGISNISDYRLYLRRWINAFENFSATRREPDGVTSRYSLRTSVPHILPNGRTILLKEKHRLVWHALLLRAHDLSKSFTETWVGLETLSFETGLSSSAVGECIQTLVILGWASQKKRNNTSPVTFLHLNPYADKDEPAQPVSIHPDDMGSYVCQAADRLRGKGRRSEDLLPDDFNLVLDLVRSYLENHDYFKRPYAIKSLTKCLLKCIEVAGSLDRCYEVFRIIVYPTTPQGKVVFEGIMRAKDLPSHLELLFPTWMMYHPLELPELPPSDIDS